MTEQHDYKDRKFSVDHYNEQYFEGGDQKHGFDSYANARAIVSDQYQIIDDVMRQRVQDGTSNDELLHIDAGCAYGHSVAKMKSLGWTSVGGDISQYAIKRGKEIYGDDFPIAVSDARNDTFWLGFFEWQAADLITSTEFFEHIPTEDVDTVLDLMSRSGRWGVFNIHGATKPGQADPTIDSQPSHLNYHHISWWIHKIAQYGEIDFEAMYDLSKRSELYNPSVYWHNRYVVVRFYPIKDIKLDKIKSNKKDKIHGKKQ